MRHQTTKSKAFLNLEGSKNIKTIHATTLKTPSALKQANIEDKNSFSFLEKANQKNAENPDIVPYTSEYSTAGINTLIKILLKLIMLTNYVIYI